MKKIIIKRKRVRKVVKPTTKPTLVVVIEPSYSGSSYTDVYLISDQGRLRISSQSERENPEMRAYAVAFILGCPVVNKTLNLKIVKEEEEEDEE